MPYYRFLDTLRALAALYVFAHHAYILQFGEGATGRLSDVLLYGHLSVTLFIVLSGFCLGLPLTTRKSIKLGRWFNRRCHRILPPYYGAIAVIGLIILIKASMLQIFLPITINGVLANLLLLGDIYPNLANQFAITFWSVCVEFKIYFLFPLLAWALYRYGVAAMLGVAVVLSTIAACIIHLFGLPLDYPCPWYVLLFAFGIVAAQINYQRQWLKAGAIAGLAFLSLLLYRFPYTASGPWELFKPHLLAIDLAAGLLFACLMAWLATRERNGWLDAAIFPWLASWSYSLYLIHYPLLKTVNLLLGSVEIKGWQAIALETIPILCLCWLFSQVFEQPFLRRR